MDARRSRHDPHPNAPRAAPQDARRPQRACRSHLGFGLALLRALDRPDGRLRVHERDESRLVDGMVHDGLLVPVLFSKTATDYAIGENGRALLAGRRAG